MFVPDYPAFAERAVPGEHPGRTHNNWTLHPRVTPRDGDELIAMQALKRTSQTPERSGNLRSLHSPPARIAGRAIDRKR
jgi:hypothetical protein